MINNKNTKLQLGIGENSYRTFFEDNTAVMLLIDSVTGEIIDANKAAEKYYGYTLNMLLNMNIKEINQLSSESVEKEMKFALSEKKSYFEFEHKLSSGEIRNVDVYSNPIQENNKKYLLSIVHESPEHKKNERLLKEKEAYIRSIFLALPAGVGVVKERVLQEVNDYMCVMTGYAREELLNKNSRMLYPDQETYESVGKEKYKQITKYGIGSVETQLQRKDGTILDVLLSSTPIEPLDISKGVTFTATDITELNQSHSDALKAKEVYRSLLEDINEWVWEVNLEGCFTYSSPRVKDIIGYSPDEVMGKSLFYFIDDGEVDLVKSIFSEIIASKSSFKNIQSTQRHKDTQDVIIETTGRPVFDNDTGELMGYRGTNRDITEHITIEKELKLKDEIMFAQSRQAAMGEMIGMIAHQWRQPITSIAMGANNIIVDSILGNIDKDSLNKLATDIVEQTQHLSKTIDDFRDFFKPNKEHDDVNVCSVIEETLSIIGTSLVNNNIKIIKEFNSQSTISTFSRELLQVYINILKNAKEALLENKIEDAKIIITVTEDENNIITTVCDNGGGVKPELLTKIFEPYFTTKEELNGTGLGLYMSNIIVTKHLKGTLQVKNSDDGACFMLKLPKVRSDNIGT
ncbi:PAS domain-containing sensor histidine kinase [Sulfurimonas aquatica]|uniref:PAS domain-containing sensor histidine kinase n=1 Tax=Sulfurimonas aquatica TaxID=2672570 RepID=UPI001A98F653|nr:PAS domain-containing sensor histidine kinase [Sulfurimonas aquatica]